MLEDVDEALPAIDPIVGLTLWTGDPDGYAVYAPGPAPFAPTRPREAPGPARGAWLVPGRVQLALGGPFIEGPGGNQPMRVALLARYGERGRVAIDLPHARFSAWTDRARLLAVVQRDQRVSFRGGMPGYGADAPQAVLRAGTAVRRLGREGEQVHVRYEGQVEIEGYVPAGALRETGAIHGNTGRWPSGSRSDMVLPGATIKAEMTWSSTTLATMARGYQVDVVAAVDEHWERVAYIDADVQVTGFLQRFAAPASVHHVRPPDVPPATIVATSTVASGTCLYAEADGEAVGYLVGDQRVDLAPSAAAASAVWWTLAIDTPWGPVAFAARGPTAHDLAACAPADTVPASELTAPSTGP